MKEFGKLTIKKGTVLLLDDKKNIKGGSGTMTGQETWGGVTCHEHNTNITCDHRCIE